MRNEEHALFTYRYMYYINKSNGHSRQKCYTHYSPRVTVTDELHKFWERLGFFVWFFFFCEILGQHYLRQAKTMEATSK